MIPARYREGSAADFQTRLKDEELGPKVRKAIEASLSAKDGGKSVRIASYAPKRAWQGKDIAAIAQGTVEEHLDELAQLAGSAC